MTTYIGLLRAVNLGPTNRVAMADLRTLLADLGLSDVRTLLQSGNVVFRSRQSSAARLEAALEEATEKRFRVATSFFVRSAEEWRSMIAANPFPTEAERDPGHLIALCLKDAPGRAAVSALQQAISGREVVRANGPHAYIVYPDGVGQSRLTSALIEKHLKTRGTGRNWNTVLKLRALTDGS